MTPAGTRGGAGPHRAAAPTRAVVLAAGRGTRLRRRDGTPIDPGQAAAAERGLKPLVPFHGHPFLAYALHELADAGVERVCLVVGPGDDPVRAAAESLPLQRLRLDLAVQREPRGVADALLAAEPVVGDEPFLMVNGDNLYPAAALAPLRDLPGPGLAAFDRDALVARSNIPADRVAAFALVRDRDGWLETIVEKPTPDEARALAGAPVSMNAWRFDAAIFDACRAAPPSPRGEIETADAVRIAMERGTRFRVVPVRAGVLDLSTRADIPAVEARLAGRVPRL